MKENFTETLKLSFDGRMLTSELLKDIEIDVHHVITDHKASVELTKGKKFISLVLTTPDLSITFAAQKESMTKDKYENVIAQAIVVHSLAQRILGNFMINFIKYSCPCKLFDKKEEAIRWLDKHWEDSMGSKSGKPVR
jgi:hypothetical protein